MKKLQLALLAMYEINAQPSGPFFTNVRLDEDAEEIKFTAGVSVSLALENAVDLCRLFNLAIVPRIEGEEITYLLI